MPSDTLKNLNGKKFFRRRSTTKDSKHYKQQIEYFNNEFSGVIGYSLAPWQHSYIERIKKYLLDEDFKKKTLLDIATGTGYVAIEMAKVGMNVIACDMSPQAIKNMEKYKKQLSLKNLEIIKCKAEEIPLRDKSADYIVANAILEHIPDEKKASAEWKRLIKNNGKLFITVPLKFKYVWPFLWPVNYIHDKRIGHLRRYDLKTLKNLFQLRTVKFFYTGHLVKVWGILLSVLLKNNSVNSYFEKLDKKKQYKKYGANNISVIFRNIR